MLLTAMKVLAVEDDEVGRTVLRQALRRLGHEVIEAVDGEAAWAHLTGEPIRIVVSDWMMPGIDGLELCRRVRARTGQDYTYFILVTARDASTQNQHIAMEAGVDDFLSKPIDVQELWMRLHVAERILKYTTRVQQLEQLLPICSYCKKVRDDHNYWQQIESYIQKRTGSEFSHSVCPDCYQRIVVPDLQNTLRSVPKAAPTAERVPPPPPDRVG
jgi:sigma-B regulation protein RsbU (phosphoserine phosphatase)